MREIENEKRCVMGRCPDFFFFAEGNAWLNSQEDSPEYNL